MRRATIAFGLLVIAGSIGCAPKPTVFAKAAGPATMPSGWTETKSSDGQVTIGVPGGWKRGSPSSFQSMGEMMSGMGMGEGDVSNLSPDMQRLAEETKQEETQMDAKEQSELDKKGILIWVNDSSKPIVDEVRTHYMVKRETMRAPTLEKAAEKARDLIKGEDEAKFVDLPIGKAARFEGLLKKSNGSELSHILYVVVNGNDAYFISFQTETGMQTISAIEKDVVNTLRIVPAKA